MIDNATEAPRILVVDDEPAICQLLTEALRGDGLDVRSVTSGAEAIEEARKNRPDLVVTDLRLGDTNGLDVIDRLRDELGDLPAVIITGHGTPEILSEASRRRPVELLNKPLDLPRLQKVIHDELQRRSNQQRFLSRHHRLRRLARKLNHERRHAYEALCNTCDDLTVTCRSLQGHMDRQEALIRYQTELLGVAEKDDVFRQLFRVCVERTGTVFGAALISDGEGGVQLVGRFGVPVPDGVNFCRMLASALVPGMHERPEVTVIDAMDNLEMFPKELHGMLVGVNLLLIPLLGDDGQFIGAALLYRKGEQPFTDDDLALAEIIACPTAVAVDKAA